MVDFPTLLSSILIAILLFSMLYTTIPAANLTAARADSSSVKAFAAGREAADIEQLIAKMGERPSLLLAKAHGIDTIMGKKITGDSGTTDRPVSKAGADVGIGINPELAENEPSIAASPITNNQIAAFHRLPNAACAVSTSNDNGESWTTPADLPLRFPGDFCADPVVRYAPADGADAGTTVRAYATYLSIRGDISSSDVVVTFTNDNGLTWSTPKVALAGSATNFMDKPWIATRYNFPAASGTAANDMTFVSATKFTSAGGCAILASRSKDGGITWSSPRTLASDSNCDPVLQGSRPAAGAKGIVAVCWYNSESDGWLVGFFDIRCRTSTTDGSFYNAQVVAVNNKNYELPYYKCPSDSYNRIWGGMMPALEISGNGALHIVYVADPTLGFADGECGNVFYTRSSASPYNSWTSTALNRRLNDDSSGTYQGYATITSRRVSGTNVLVACWEDARHSYDYDFGGDPANIVYDIYCDRTDPSWGPNERVSEVSSLTDFSFHGDYIDSAAHRSTAGAYAAVIWTDRSDKDDIFDEEDDVFRDVVSLGKLGPANR